MSIKTPSSAAETSSKAPRQVARRRSTKKVSDGQDVSNPADDATKLDAKAKPARRTKPKTAITDTPAQTATRRVKAQSKDLPQAEITAKDGDDTAVKPRRAARKASSVAAASTAAVIAAQNASDAPPKEKSAPKRRARRKTAEVSPTLEGVADLKQPRQTKTSAPKRKSQSDKTNTVVSSNLKNPDADPDAASVKDASEKDAEAKISEGSDAALPDFDTLGLSPSLLKAIQEVGYKTPTPIQARAIPFVLQKRDVLGVAQTGTGKTASFTLPMLELLAGSRARARMPRSLILEPTRELALQVSENLSLYGKHLKLNHALLIGGESMVDQRAVLNQGVDILIATPGRLMDLFERGGLLLNQASILVIDEADRMLDMGFIPDIQRIVSLLPANRQTLFFSATMAPEIRNLADQFLVSPEEITVSRPSSVATTIEEALIIVHERNKRRTLRTLLQRENVQSAIVFCNRKRDVDVLYKSLHKHRFSVGHLHGDLPQSTRFKTLEQFKAGEIKILVCSDVAARGIDIGGLSHVYNFDLPFNAEDYVHRIGRTGRAGRTGHAYSLASPSQKPLLDAIETLTHKKLPQPDLEGIEQLDWSESPERGDRANKSAQTGRKTRVRSESAHVQSDTNPENASAPLRHEGKRRQNKNEREFLPVEVDHHGPGFGASIPHFMSAPRRQRLQRATDDVQDSSSSTE